MKLIYAKGTCSLSVHILLEELGLKYEKQEVSLSDKTILNKYNPNGYVPVLVLEDGTILTEAISILQFIAERQFDSIYFPMARSLKRARCIEWLVFMSTEIHKGISPLFYREELTPRFRDRLTRKIEARLIFLNEHLTHNNFLLDDEFTIADMYAIAILRIVEHVKIRLDKFPEVERYKLMMELVPSVEKVILEEEGVFVREELWGTEEAQISS